MPKLRIIYIVSLVVLAVLIGFTVFRPMATGDKYSEVQKEQLVETESEWIVKFYIINHEGRDQYYTISVNVDNDQFSKEIRVRDGRRFTYIHHIRPEEIIDGNASFAIYKEGEDTPFEQVTYYLK
jgi:hypothetical protein